MKKDCSSDLMISDGFGRIYFHKSSPGGTDQNLVPDVNVRTRIDDFGGAVYESCIVQIIEPMLIITCIVIGDLFLGPTVRQINFTLDRKSKPDFFGYGDTVFKMRCADLLIAVEA